MFFFCLIINLFSNEIEHNFITFYIIKVDETFVGCYRCGAGDVTSNACRCETLVNGLTSSMVANITTASTYTTSNNCILVKFSSGMKIVSCKTMCKNNNFLFAGLINS